MNTNKNERKKVKSYEKTWAVISLTLAVLAFAAVPAYACTGIYVGPEASSDGTSIIAGSNDCQDVWANYVDIVERVENKPGRTMAVDSAGTVFDPLPDTTYRYTATP